MAFLIAVAGWSGCGKTTSVNYLCKAGAGEKIYLGETVLNEIHARGMSQGPESEQQVRLDLRAQYGQGAFAARAVPAIKRHLDQGTNVLVDAVFDPEEYRCFQENFAKDSELILLSIEACFETRARRVIARSPRSLTREQLRDRDKYEAENLRTAVVISGAHHKIANEGSIDDFQNNLTRLWRAVTGAS
jgi:dephospho-CoA kinase